MNRPGTRIGSLLLALAVAAGVLGPDQIVSLFIHPSDTRRTSVRQDRTISRLRELRREGLERLALQDEHARKLDEILCANERVFILVKPLSFPACEAADRYLRKISPLFPSVTVLVANEGTREWRAIIPALEKKGWGPVTSLPYLVAVRGSSPLGFYVGFDARDGSTTMSVLFPEEPGSGSAVRLDDVLAHLSL